MFSVEQFSFYSSLRTHLTTRGQINDGIGGLGYVKFPNSKSKDNLYSVSYFAKHSNLVHTAFSSIPLDCDHLGSSDVVN
jgi:hypothetical protein